MGGVASDSLFPFLYYISCLSPFLYYSTHYLSVPLVFIIAKKSADHAPDNQVRHPFYKHTTCASNGPLASSSSGHRVLERVHRRNACSLASPNSVHLHRRRPPFECQATDSPR